MPRLESSAPKMITSSEAPTFDSLVKRKSSQNESAVIAAISAAMLNGSVIKPSGPLKI